MSSFLSGDELVASSSLAADQGSSHPDRRHVWRRPACSLGAPAQCGRTYGSCCRWVGHQAVLQWSVGVLCRLLCPSILDYERVHGVLYLTIITCPWYSDALYSNRLPFSSISFFPFYFLSSSSPLPFAALSISSSFSLYSLFFLPLLIPPSLNRLQPPCSSCVR